MRHSIATIFILSLVLISGCSYQHKSITVDEKPNIIWMVTEDISPALGCYGDDYAITPALDKFAEKAIRFEHAYATAPICAPSRSCLITGIYATSMGTQHLRTQVAKPTFIKTFPEYLKEAGYFVTNIGMVKTVILTGHEIIIKPLIGSFPYHGLHIYAATG